MDASLLEKRFTELAKRSRQGYYLFSDFLGLSEQAVFNKVSAALSPCEYTVFGGVPGTERVMVRFGNAEELGYEEPFPISIIKIAPKSEKFADKLTHRDFLGAILNLGIEREAVGDIAIANNVGYVFVSDKISEYIRDSLTKIKHTDVLCSITEEAPAAELYQTRRIRIQAQSERVDATAAKVFSLSREDALTYIKRGLIFINGTPADTGARRLKPGDKVSVRGEGRFIYLGYESLSKKGKLNIDIDLYL